MLRCGLNQCFLVEFGWVLANCVLVAVIVDHVKMTHLEKYSATDNEYVHDVKYSFPPSKHWIRMMSFSFSSWFSLTAFTSLSLINVLIGQKKCSTL